MVKRGFAATSKPKRELNAIACETSYNKKKVKLLTLINWPLYQARIKAQSEGGRKIYCPLFLIMSNGICIVMHKIIMVNQTRTHEISSHKEKDKRVSDFACHRGGIISKPGEEEGGGSNNGREYGSRKSYQ